MIVNKREGEDNFSAAPSEPEEASEESEAPFHAIASEMLQAAQANDHKAFHSALQGYLEMHQARNESET